MPLSKKRWIWVAIIGVAAILFPRVPRLTGKPPIARRSTSQRGPQLGNCPVLPVDHIWNTPVDQFPVDTSSNDYIRSIGSDQPLHADFGAGLYKGAPIGIPYTLIEQSQRRVGVKFDYVGESDLQKYPIPADVAVEGGENSTGDRHVITVDGDSCLLYELYNARPQADGSWQAGSGAVFDLRAYGLRPPDWTSADAAGLPILPGLVRYEEVAAGEIRHAIRFTAPRTRAEYVWPARHAASKITDARYPPMGQRFRLRADFDITGYPPQGQVILAAMKKYGMMLADNGSPWFISGTPDDGWDNSTLASLKKVHGEDFEAVASDTAIISRLTGRAAQSR